MTTTEIEPRRTSRQRAMEHPARRPKGRVATVVVLLVSMLCAGLLRQVVSARQDKLVNLRGTAASRSTLGSMDSFALALLLGGLRGPLIMFLWPAIENQKNYHDLRSVDTMIEWVRLLQPEFDTVHMFQIWNKAYNLSAMMASPANKYQVIMEAIDYAQRVDDERPGDINILGAMSNVYGGKFGSTNLPEFAFYGKQFRQETMTDANRLKAFPDDAKRYQRLYKWEPLLDANNNIVAKDLAPTRTRPGNIPADGEWNDGSALQYLKPYQPFPYGISPLAMAYNYAKRAEVAQSVEGQQPLQLSSMVIDSQPALTLKFWEEDDQRHGRAYEAKAFGISTADTQKETDAAMANIKVGDNIVNRQAIGAALWHYASGTHIAREAIKEYERHLSKQEYAIRRPVYLSHLADMNAAILMNTADKDYLTAIVTDDAKERSRLLNVASDNYYKAMIRLERSLLEFYTEDAILFDKHSYLPGGNVLPPAKNGKDEPDKRRVFQLEDSQVNEVYDKAMRVAVNSTEIHEHNDDRTTFGLGIARCRARMMLIMEELHKDLGPHTRDIEQIWKKAYVESKEAATAAEKYIDNM